MLQGRTEKTVSVKLGDSRIYFGHWGLTPPFNAGRFFMAPLCLFYRKHVEHIATVPRFSIGDVATFKKCGGVSQFWKGQKSLFYVDQPAQVDETRTRSFVCHQQRNADSRLLVSVAGSRVDSAPTVITTLLCILYRKNFVHWKLLFPVTENCMQILIKYAIQFLLRKTLQS